PDNIAAAVVYAQALINQKKFAGASAILAEAGKKQPRNYDLLTTYANAQAGTGQTAAALDNLAAAIKLAPEKTRAYLARAQIIAIYHPELLDAAADSYRKARKLGAKPDVFLENTLAKQLTKTSKDTEMIAFLQEPAKEAEQNRDWSSAAWYFGQLHKLKPADKEYREKFAAALLLQKKYKESLAALNLNELSDNARLIAASAELCRGNCSQAASLLKSAKPAKSMPVYFNAVEKELKSASQNREKQEEFTQLCSRLEKLLQAAK
ncbi:MAG: hypothetical protein PHV59_11550, partial [Victivallales bacterium]|nr:hypothetical protein [Victivallales bacterium]